MSEIFVARQAIFDRNLEVVGYELLFRGAEDDDSAVFDDVDRASFRVLLNSFLDIGLEQIVGETPAFLNLTRRFFLSTRTIPFPRDRVVLELLEDMDVDDELVDRVREYAQKGYRIALDDFVYRVEMEPLLEIADIVKLDVLDHDEASLVDQMNRARPFGVQLLAEKVETPEQFEMCERLEFDLFQGYFLCRPKILRGQHVPSNRVSMLHLLSRLQDPGVEIDELERLIREDLSLSYKLLRLINSAYNDSKQPIESIRQTLVILGVQRIRAWVSLLTLSGLDDKPHELVVSSMVRAKMCERIARVAGRTSPDVYFTVGLFSMLDALLDLPMTQVVDDLPLSDEIRAALVGRSGPLGETLDAVMDYERGDFEAVGKLGLAPMVVREIYLESLDWARFTEEEIGIA